MHALKPIPNYADYFADTNGTIWSRKVGGSSRKAGDLRELRPSLNTHGYRFVNLRKDGHSYPRHIGRLVLETFCGLPPEGMETCHGINGRLDDSLANLCWGTRSKNNGEDKHRDGTALFGEKNHNCKLTEMEVLQIRGLCGQKSCRQIAQKFEISPMLVSLIQRKKLWGWLQDSKQ